MSGAETARLLNNAEKRNRVADEYEAKAIELAMSRHHAQVMQAAAYFTVADGLRGRARWRV